MQHKTRLWYFRNCVFLFCFALREGFSVCYLGFPLPEQRTRLYGAGGMGMKRNSTVTLVECALMIALSTVLSMLKVLDLPGGGSITLASMVPLVLVSYRHGLKWGLGTALVHSLLQIVLNFSAPPTKTLGAFFLVILLDYILAFTALGSAAFWGKALHNRTASVVLGASVAVFLRFLCSFFSGILIWGEYAPEGTPVWLYSLLYNGSYMLPELILTAIVSAGLIKVLDRIDNGSSARTA